MKYNIKWSYNNKNIFFLGPKLRGGGSKNNNLGHLRKLNQILHNQWAPRSLKVQKLPAQNEGGGAKNESLCPWTKFNQILYT